MFAAPPAGPAAGAALGIFGGLWLPQTDFLPMPIGALMAALALTGVVGKAMNVGQGRRDAQRRAAWGRFPDREIALAAIPIQPVRHSKQGG